MAKARRTTHRSSAGTKLYAVRDSSGKFEDIQTFKRAHAADLRRTSTAEVVTAEKKAARKAAAPTAVAKKAAVKKAVARTVATRAAAKKATPKKAVASKVSAKKAAPRKKTATAAKKR